MAGFKLGIVSLGKAAGKIKYALLDERDISLVNQYVFEAKVDVDRDGNGASIFAFVYDAHRGKESGKLLHEFLWEKHCGGVAVGWKVVHKNGITVDNRMENLRLVPNHAIVETTETMPTKSQEQSVYWLAVQQLQTVPLQCQYPPPHHLPMYNKFYSPNGEDVFLEESDICMYYECHYPPCTNMEKQVKEFSMCSRCQEVRYCGTFCQQRDWAVHKKYCRERWKEPDFLNESLPER